VPLTVTVISLPGWGGSGVMLIDSTCTTSESSPVLPSSETRSVVHPQQSERTAALPVPFARQLRLVTKRCLVGGGGNSGERSQREECEADHGERRGEREGERHSAGRPLMEGVASSLAPATTRSPNAMHAHVARFASYHVLNAFISRIGLSERRAIAGSTV
jgi:hypothetical protein